jgi:hypothetical protein
MYVFGVSTSELRINYGKRIANQIAEITAFEASAFYNQFLFIGNSHYVSNAMFSPALAA